MRPDLNAARAIDCTQFPFLRSNGVAVMAYHFALIKLGDHFAPGKADHVRQVLYLICADVVKREGDGSSSVPAVHASNCQLD